ncbi:MAG: HD domain-containing protein [Oscillospiraceae bacterium]|jgi:putative two-component system response regulator|nr:HD domain-containing protein [Oscillospiraceae bacterium]
METHSKTEYRLDEHMRMIMDTIPLAVVVAEPTLRVLDCSQYAIKMLGTANKQEFLRRFISLVPEYQPDGQESREKMTGFVKAALENGHVRFDWAHLTAAGFMMMLDVSLTHTTLMGSPVVVGFARDTHNERMLMDGIEQRDSLLAAQTYLYDSVMNLMSFPVRVADAQLNWTSVNTAAERLFGITREDMLGKPCDQRKFCVCGTDNCCLQRAKRGLMQTFFDHEGRSYQVDVKIFNNAEGTPLGYIEMIHDITEAASSARRQADMEKEVIRTQAEGLSFEVGAKTREIHNLQSAMISGFADLVEFRDKSTGGHIMRTQLYMKALIEGLAEKGRYREEISSWDVENVLLLSQLHDMGKITISDTILNKPGRLTPEEFEIMKTHVQAGVDAINQILQKTEEHQFLRHALNIIGSHHERWDGKGYPNGLAGGEIPLEGRIMAVADVYDALVSWRPYKEPFSHEAAAEIIESGAGSSFDPVLVDVFRDVKDRFQRIKEENGEG